MTDAATSPTVTFLMTMKKLDRAKVTPRDVTLLYSIISRPGMHGQELAHTIGIVERSSIQPGIARLIRYGLIEDRRREHNQVTPNILHATPAGVAFWNEIKPA